MLQVRLRFEDIDWLDLRAIAKHSPPTSALYRAVNPESWVTPELTFLRDIEHRLSWLVWAKSTDAAANRNRPKPLPLTEAERNAAKTESERYNPQTVDATLATLGWND